jgi:hypothetical protein
LSTIVYFINPTKAIFNPSEGWILLGTITPGESTRNIKGFWRILNPANDLVVATEAVDLAAPFLFYKSEIILIWLIIELFPTFGMPHIPSQSPTF